MQHRGGAGIVLGLVLTALPAAPATALPLDLQEVVVWESGGLSEDSLTIIDLVARITGTTYTTVDTGSLRMLSVMRGETDIQRPAPGFGYPMLVSAIDPVTAGPLLGPVMALALQEGAVMSERSAALRNAKPGDLIELEGWNGVVEQIPIVAVLPDAEMDWAEVAISRTLAERLDFDRPSTVHIWGERGARVGPLLEMLFPASAPVRISQPGVAPEVLDATLPAVAIKERFGEFSFRPANGDLIEIDKDWRERSIVTVEMPGLGEFKCHQRLVPYIRAALRQVDTEGLYDLIDPVDFQLAGGCFNARLMRGGDKGFAVSRHAWGAAFDLNPTSNQYGAEPTLDPRIGQIFRDWGFVWGAGWTVPDGMHFEWKGSPTQGATTPCADPSRLSAATPMAGWAVYARDRECAFD
jgi:hypothetical protein